jgi:hypothetical protein
MVKYSQEPTIMSAKRVSKISPRFTELIDLSTLKMGDIVFDSPQEVEIQQGNKTIKYYKLNIGCKNDAGVGEFVFNIPFFCHSFGVEEFTNEAGVPTNHNASLSLVDMNGTPEEQQTQLAFVKQFSSVIDKIKEHLVSIKKEIKKPTLDKNDLKALNPMKQAVDEDGNPKGNAYYFSPKLMEKKIYNKDDPSDMKIEVVTEFFLDGQFDERGNPVQVSPLEFMGKKHFKFRGAVKIDNVYIGSKISIQCKIYDGVVRPVSMERKRMTAIGNVTRTVTEMLLADD